MMRYVNDTLLAPLSFSAAFCRGLLFNRIRREFMPTVTRELSIRRRLIDSCVENGVTACAFRSYHDRKLLTDSFLSLSSSGYPRLSCNVHFCKL